MTEELIIILALDNLVATYWEALTSEDTTFEDNESEMACREIYDYSRELLLRRLGNLPSDVRANLCLAINDEEESERTDRPTEG